MLQQRDDEICNLEERLHIFEASNERLERENTSLNYEVNRHNENAREILNRSQIKIDECNKNNLDLEQEKDNYKRDLLTFKDKYNIEINNYNKIKRNQDSKIMSQNNKLESMKREVVSIQEDMRRSNLRIDDLEREKNITVEE